MSILKSIKNLVVPEPLKLSQMLLVSYYAALGAELGREHFISPKLMKAEREGSIRVVALAASVEHLGKTYEIEQLLIPMVWSHNEENEPVENNKVVKAAHLLRNAWEAHDLILEGYLEDHDLVVSREYRYALRETFTKEGGMWTNIYTAYCKLPKNSLRGV